MKLAILIGLCSIAGLFIVYQVRMMIREARANRAAQVAVPEAPRKARVVGITDWGGVFVEADADTMLLVVLPQREPVAREQLRGDLPIGWVIVINDPTLDGYLCTTVICETYGIAHDAVFATVKHARIDRLPDDNGDARAAGFDELHLGDLTVRPVGRNAVVVMPHGIVIGAAITGAQLAELPIVRVVGTTRDVAADPAVLEPMMERSEGRGGFSLLAGTVPGIDKAFVEELRTFGVPVEVVEPDPAWVAAGAELIAAIPDPAKLDTALDVHHAVVWRAMIGLIAGGDRATAQRLGDAALAKREDPDVRHQLAVLATLAGDRESAERHLRAAASHAPSMINLAITLARREDAEAIELADRAVQLMPEDALAHRAAVMVRAYANDIEGARATLAAAKPLDARARVELEHAIGVLATGERPPIVDTFPMHAEIAFTRGRELLDRGEHAGAVVALEHAYALHPQGLEIAAELGVALTKADRIDDAKAHYETAIERIPGGDLLRLNRGNLRLRAGDHAGAIADFQEVVRKVPQLHDARILLIVTLVNVGQLAEAAAEIDALADHGGPPELIAEMRRVIEDPKPQT